MTVFSLSLLKWLAKHTRFRVKDQVSKYWLKNEASFRERQSDRKKSLMDQQIWWEQLNSIHKHKSLPMDILNLQNSYEKVKTIFAA